VGEKDGLASVLRYNVLAMRISIISDTHMLHEELGTLSGDVLIHCGDMLDLFNRTDADLQKLDVWFGRQDFKLILCTGGNHDMLLEQIVAGDINPFENAVFLQDKPYEYQGVRFYGAPWTPDLDGHAFYQNAEQLKDSWSKIPENIDVLITHTPPRGILDVSSRGLELGCEELAIAVNRIKPKLHCFGHVHASAGETRNEATTFVNACVVNSQFDVARGAKVVDI